MSRKKKHAEHANHERWLVSYADFITLLFAFFVVMFASSQVDKRKVGKIALAVQVAFQQLGVFEASNSKMPLSETEPMPFSDVQLAENSVRTADVGRLVDVPNAKGFHGPHGLVVPGPSNIQKELEEALAKEIGQNSVSISLRREGLVISLREVGFFDSGSATLKPEALKAIDKIVSVLSNQPQYLRIEGHTDNIPIHTAQFASNWELSTARSTAMISLFMDRYGFDPSRLAAAGYAEFHPVASNDNPEGRGLNRRVDIVLLNPEAADLAMNKPIAPASDQSKLQSDFSKGPTGVNEERVKAGAEVNILPPLPTVVTPVSTK